MRKVTLFFMVGLMGCVSTTWAAEAKDSARKPVTKPPAAVETLVKMDLFVAGEDGYATYRIPGIVVTQRGTILAYCAARKDGIGDWADIDIALRRSWTGSFSKLRQSN
ncbi:MAG: sialidase family protein [Planctomycetota bacterium]|nr:sialidase family protein [Planctomycetota bacterium]